jgi:hypothetical protein
MLKLKAPRPGKRREASPRSSMAGNLKSLAAVIEDAVKLLSQGENAKFGRIEITIANEEGETIRIIVDEKTTASFQGGLPVTDDLSDLENSIIELLHGSGHALRGKEIAARIEERFTSHFREILSDLSRRGLILRTTQGYTSKFSSSASTD